jgi:hypothetical protein
MSPPAAVPATPPAAAPATPPASPPVVTAPAEKTTSDSPAPAPALPPIPGEVGVEASYALAAPNAPTPTPPEPRAEREAPPPPELHPEPPRDEPHPALRRRSKAAMTAGVLLTSAAPIALLGALIARNNQTRCDDDVQARFPGHIVPSSERYQVERCDDYSATIYALSIGGGVLAAVGIPLIVYGGRRVPDEKATRVSISPWATMTSGGLRLGYDL